MFIAIISLPLMLMNDTSKFGSITFISLASLFFIMTLVCIQAPSYQTQYNPLKTLNMFNNLDKPLLVLQNLGLFTFALYTLDVFFLITNNLGKAATPKNIMTVSAVSVNTLIIPYIIIGIMGYYSFGDYILNIDLFPARPSLLQYNDILMKIGMVLVIFGVCLGNISRFIALKQLCFEIINKDLTWKRNVIFTVCYLYVPGLIGFAYPKVNDWVALIGGFCMSSLGILFLVLWE